MASDFDKPVSGVWNMPESMLSAHGKSGRNDPTDIDSATCRVQKKEGKAMGESSNKQAKAKIDVRPSYLPAKQTPDLAAAARLDVLLLSSMYGATNLSYQFPQAPSGSISPFGLPVFPPFGLSFPPVPVSPLPQATNAGQSVFTVNKPPARVPQRNTKQKPTKATRKDIKSPKVSAPQSYTFRSAQSNCSVRSDMHTTNKGTVPRPGSEKLPRTYPHGLVGQDGAKKVDLPNSPSLSDIASIIPVTQLLQSGLAPLLFNMNANIVNSQAYSQSSESCRPCTGHNALPTPAVGRPVKLVETAPMLNTPTNTRRCPLPNSTKPNTTYPSLVVGQTAPLHHDAVQAQFVMPNLGATDRRAGCRNPKQTSLGDAEAAAILIGLRHGGSRLELGHSGNSHAKHTGAASGQRKRPTSLNPGQHIASKAMRIDDFSQRQHLISGPDGVVDLSAKTSKARRPLHRNEVKGLPLNFVASVLDDPLNPKIATASQLQAHKQGKNKRTVIGDSFSTKVKCDRKQQLLVSSIVGASSTAESSGTPVRHFIPAEHGRPKQNAASTSVVTNLPSCICAFDCRSPVEGYPGVYESPEEIMLKSQSANNGGFNFKKVICNKFRQSTDTPVGHWYPVNECREALVEEDDHPHGVALNSLMRSKSASSQAISSNSENNRISLAQFPSKSNTQITPSKPGNELKLKADNPVFAVRTGYDVANASCEKPAEHAIDFRVKKRSSGERQGFDGGKSIAATHGLITDGKPERSLDKPSSTVQPALRTLQSDGGTASPQGMGVTASSEEPRERHTGASAAVSKGIPNALLHTNTSARHEITKTTPSFSDLRKKSGDTQALRQHQQSPSVPAHSFQSFLGRDASANQSKEVKHHNPKLPVSNLYRIRNSALGDSNESLNSIGTESDAQADDTDGMSDSSYSSCESAYSRRRGGTNWSGSDAESDRDDFDAGDIAGDVSSDDNNKTELSRNKVKSPTSRPRFVLNRPKFTVTGGLTVQPTPVKDDTASELVVKSPVSHIPPPAIQPTNTASPASKIKIRSPTFTFSSESRASASGNSQAYSPTKATVKIPEKLIAPAAGSSRVVDAPRKENSVKEATSLQISTPKVPELKCDEGENGQSFKAMFIRALNKSNQKEGLAVDGKSLRALLGEATCFYHNNRKYVLTRGVAKVKPKQGFIADVSESKGTIFPAKKVEKDINNNNEAERGRSCQPVIEPRVSVTAIKKKKDRKKKRNKGDKIKTHSKLNDVFGKRRKPAANDSEESGKFHKSKVADVASRHDDVTHKRHRRIYEIENLVFEGAGGSTPIPDISLRDSDVFTNIKLRRREAAKRGISETSGDERSAARKAKKSSKSRDRKRLIKSAARERAAVNKTRKKSIEKKLRKYKKRNRIFLMMKTEDQTATEHPRATCVRINAGVARPHLEVQAYAAQEIRKFRRNSTGEAKTDESQQIAQENDENIDIVTLETEITNKEKQETRDECLDAPQTLLSLISHSAENGNQPASAREATCTNTAEVPAEQHGLAQNQRVKGRDCAELPIQESAGDKVCRDDVSTSETAHTTESDATDDKNGEQRRYPKRTIKPKSVEEEEPGKKRKTSEDDEHHENSLTYDVNNCESDSVRSDSPLLASSRSSKHRKRASVSKGRVSPLSVRVKGIKFGQELPTTTANSKNGFRLLSFFTAPSAVTLGPAYGDLQPSYSVKTAMQNSVTSQGKSWQVGDDAQEIKQQLQRELWRTMTLDMFTNMKA